MENNKQLVKLIAREVRKVLESGVLSPVTNETRQNESHPVQVVEKAIAQPIEQKPEEPCCRIEQKVITQEYITRIDSSTRKIAILRNAVITPLASDYIKEKGIEVVRITEEKPVSRKKPVFGILSSRSSNDVLREIKRVLDEKNISYEEFNNVAAIEANSYRINLGRLIESVIKKNVRFGLCIDDTGIGTPLIANRTEGIQAVFCPDKDTAVIARKDFDANMLIMTKRTFNNKDAENIISAWLV